MRRLYRECVAICRAQGIGALLVPVPALASDPTAGPNHLVDLDHGLLFPQNKQNEPATTRDPISGVLVAGANEEGAVSRTYDDGQTWSYPVVAPRYERASRLLPTADLARWSRPTQHELPRQLRRHRHVRRLDRAL